MEVPSIFLNRILAEAAKKRASSLILTVGSLPVLRLDSHLYIMETESLVTVDTAERIINFLLDDSEKLKLKQDREIVLVRQFGGHFRFRANIFYQKGLPSLSFHYVPAEPRNLADLRLPNILKNLIVNRFGLIVIAGPKFSGKTTTSASIIEEINKTKRRHIIAIENPSEYLFTSKRSIIEQRQVGRDVKTVVQGLKHCLREDADMVYLGEIKDEFKEAMPLILELAAGNCLVILEINTNSATRTVDKILNFLRDSLSPEAARYNLADVLIGVFVQKLLPHVGGSLVLASETLVANPAVKSLIREGKIYQIESVIQTSRGEGMISMDKSLEELAAAGEIKREEMGL